MLNSECGIDRFYVDWTWDSYLHFFSMRLALHKMVWWYSILLLQSASCVYPKDTVNLYALPAFSQDKSSQKEQCFCHVYPHVFSHAIYMGHVTRCMTNWMHVSAMWVWLPNWWSEITKTNVWMNEFFPLWKVMNPTTFWNSQKTIEQTVMSHKWYAQLITYEFEKTRNPDSQTFASRFWRIRFVVTSSTPWWRSLPLRDFLLPRRSCS